jgi:FtsP/CotA-like multicopper oxidase with cupredoxin domain
MNGGPLLKVKCGETFTVSFENKIDDEVDIHWHGMELPAKMDGHPMYVIAP